MGAEDNKLISGILKEKIPNEGKGPKGDILIEDLKISCWDEKTFDYLQEGVLYTIEYSEKENEYGGKSYLNRNFVSIIKDQSVVENLSKRMQEEVERTAKSFNVKKEPENTETNNYVVLDIETTGLDPFYSSEITCICAKAVGETINIFKKSRTQNEDESSILYPFFQWLESFQDYTLITANGKRFDVPFLLARIAIHRYNWREESLFITKMDHIDLQQITKKPVSLNNLAKLFSVKTKSGNGEDAIRLFFEDRLEEVVDYCMTDVEITESVYLKYLKIKNEETIRNKISE